MGNDLIVKANALVEASYHLTANEQRLILSAITQIPKDKSVTDDEVYFISAKDMVELGLNETTAYRELYEAGKRLFARTITIKTPAGTLKTRWVQDLFKFNESELNSIFPVFDFETPSEVSIGIRFNKSVLPFLNNLTSNFTKYKLTEIAGFSSAYSYRIYEFLMQYQSTGYVKISINELRGRLQLGDKYPATKDLKVRVIDIAVREINEKSPYKVEYTLIKTGKKFTHIELKLKKNNKPKELDKKDPNTIDIFDNLTDKERELIAQKNAYADQKGITDPLHRQNLIKQALEQHKQADQLEQEQKEREKAERQAQKQQEKECLELAQRQYERILADGVLIQRYFETNTNTKYLQGLQGVYYREGNLVGAFQMERHRFEQLHQLKYVNLEFLK